MNILQLPIVIDDFHYVPASIRTALSRTIKSLIPAIPVLLIAVNAEAFEAVRAEPDLNGRVWRLEIAEWSQEELGEIAKAGFAALNVSDPGEGIGSLLAVESHHSPFLMQQLSLDFMTMEGILQRQADTRILARREAMDDFFYRIARRTMPPVFDDLLRGPGVRGTARVTRTLRNGLTPDIYGAVLYALARIPNPGKAHVTDLRAILARDAVQAVSSQDISNALHQMSRIAYERRGDSDPVLVFRREEVHILDPILGFFLRRGRWEDEALTAQ